MCFILLKLTNAKQELNNRTMSEPNQNLEVEVITVFELLPSQSYSVGERNILQTVLLQFFLVFMPSTISKVIMIVIQFMSSPNGLG